MKLFEIFASTYVVKPISAGAWDVTKFSDKKEPEAQRRVEKRKNGFWTDSPGYIHRGQDEKNIKIVKQFINDGEPSLTSYMVDDKTGKITKTKFS